MNRKPVPIDQIYRAYSRLHNPQVKESAALVPLNADVTRELMAIEEKLHREKTKKQAFWTVRPMVLRTEAMKAGSAYAKKQSSVASSTDINEAERDLLFSSYTGRLIRYECQSEPELADDNTVVSSSKVGPSPKIELTPVRAEPKVDLFPACTFTLASAADNTVEMVWRPVGESSVNRVMMEYESPGVYRTALSLGFGSYVFSYSIDGVVVPPSSHAQHVRLQGNGVFAHLEHRRPKLILRLTNNRKIRELVSLATDEKWLVSGTFLVPPESSVYVGLTILPDQLSLGMNEGVVRLRALRPAEVNELGILTIKIEGIAQGAVADLHCDSPSAVDSDRVATELCFKLNVMTRGTGAFTGMLLLPQLGDSIDFEIGDVSESLVFSHDLVVPTQKIPHRESGRLKVLLINDSYLTNQRVIRSEVPYNVVYLKKSLPALLFGSLRPGAAKTLRLSARRSDGKKFSLNSVIPAHAANYLMASRNDTNTLSFRLDASKLQPGATVDDTIVLTDVSSGLRDTIRVMAQVLGT